jgi:hypothetical protein
MNNPNSVFPKTLSTTQYVLALHEPDDRVAVVVRNRFASKPRSAFPAQKTSPIPPFKTGFRSRTSAAQTCLWA